MPKESPRVIYTGSSSGTNWFVGIIIAMALLVIGYLVFSANECGRLADTCVVAIESTN